MSARPAPSRMLPCNACWQESKENMLLTPCYHVFCPTCTFQHIQTKGLCFLCKRPVAEKDCRYIQPPTTQAELTQRATTLFGIPPKKCFWEHQFAAQIKANKVKIYEQQREIDDLKLQLQGYHGEDRGSREVPRDFPVDSGGQNVSRASSSSSTAGPAPLSAHRHVQLSNRNYPQPPAAEPPTPFPSNFAQPPASRPSVSSSSHRQYPNQSPAPRPPPPTGSENQPPSSYNFNQASSTPYHQNSWANNRASSTNNFSSFVPPTGKPPTREWSGGAAARPPPSRYQTAPTPTFFSEVGTPAAFQQYPRSNYPPSSFGSYK